MTMHRAETILDACITEYMPIKNHLGNVPAVCKELLIDTAMTDAIVDETNQNKNFLLIIAIP
jgi:hypothetical protein